ncbi:Inner membrane protein YbaL [Gemmata sp. SH-PL17]|uniref:cation:proton antiporter n=1 Tax=Gemmata sp. SH-PL17 TaxID=1630693 RepID=UPI00078D263E|nr:cation:proton antiporter [Gemmata sp. SH-PL17]AMV25077.1 Inner membrane protein YbaL [Gemmata sp. SH-PL17]
MHDTELILTLTFGLTVALAFGYVTHRIGLSPIVGYLLAGIVVGPHTPGFVADKHLAEQMAEIGVILLMFGVGLHFHFDELLAVRRIALPGAIVQSLVATVLGAVVALALGWGASAGVVFGLALSVASTVVLTRVLSDANELHTPTGHIAIGWLVVEDIFTVLVLVLLPPLFGNSEGGLALAVGLAVVKIGLLIAVAMPVGGRVIPWLLNRVADTGSRELFTLTVLVVALGIAVGSSMLFGVSMALGAFLAGMIVGRSDFSLRAASDALPMRDAFAVLFFVSVGMLFDPHYLIDAPLVVLATLAVVMIGKPLAAIGIVLLLGYPVRIAIAVAVALGQIGEFSFILAALGTKLKVLPDEATSALVAAAIVSISVNPLLYRAVGPIEAWAAARPRLWHLLNSRRRGPGGTNPVLPEESDPRYRAVVIGYGPVGRTLARLLKENGIVPTIIEMNLETVRRLRSEGIAAVYGDAARQDTLKEAGLDQAGSLILSASGLKGAEEVVRLARELNPAIRVLARSAYLRERADLRKAGADEVFAGEGEVALAMTESVLRELGAAPEQIDRERERVRTDLFGDTTSEEKKG